jgi:hypothetical protein
MMLPNLPTLLGIKSAWLLLALKIAATVGFFISANMVILYAS